MDELSKFPLKGTLPLKVDVLQIKSLNVTKYIAELELYKTKGPNHF